MPRFLAIDPGGRRTGLALGDSETGLVSPALCPPVAPNGVIHHAHDAERLALLRKVVDREMPDALVLGLPLHIDGTAGAQARKSEALAARLRALTALPVHLQDERLSSAAADEVMAGTGLTHKQKKARRDALAACAVLRDFLARADTA